MPTRHRRLTRRDVDVRLGYAGLGVGALTVVLVLVASLLVIEVSPRVDLPGALAARQTVVRYPTLESVPVSRVPARTGRDRSPDLARTDRDPVLGSSTPTPTPDESVTSDDGGWDDATGTDGGGGTPGRPGTPVPGSDGAVSQVVDYVIDDLTGALDQTTGGATTPVTGPAGGLVDGVTDLADDLLGQP